MNSKTPRAFLDCLDMQRRVRKQWILPRYQVKQCMFDVYKHLLAEYWRY